MNEYGRQVDKTTIRFERLLPGPIERVWDYIADPQKRSEWFAGGNARIEKPGPIKFLFDHRNLTTPDDIPPEKYKDNAGEMSVEITIVKVEPPNLLVWEWADGPSDVSKVQIELGSRGDKVLLTLTESRLSGRDRIISNSGGWHIHLVMLEAKLAGAAPPPFWATHTRLEAEYAERFGLNSR